MNKTEPQTLSADCAAHHSSARLLIVDDEPEFLTPLCEFLSRSGYEVRGVTSGTDALAELRGRSFDLLLTDMIMPEMDGIELLKAAFEVDHELVAIVITGHGTISSAVEAMKVGAFDYMVKPLEFRTLGHTLNRAMTVRRLRMENVQLRETLDVYMLKEALRETENFYRTIFENTGTAMSIVEDDATISLVNAEFEKLSGYSKDEIEGKKRWADFMSADDLERMQQYYRMVTAGQDPRPRNFEFRFLDRNGTAKDIFMTTAVIPGTRKGMAALMDITERKEAEEKVQSYQNALRSLASALSLTEERERRRIATDLHDNIGQLLALTQIKLGVLGEGSSGNLRNQVDEIGKLVAEAILFTRSLTAELSPPVLHQLGFGAAMEWLAEEIQKNHGIRVDFRDDHKPKPLDEEIQTILFKVARELLVNVVKHARASKVSVSLERSGDYLILVVEDNGTGFNPSILEPQGKSPGFGLFNVRERLETIGGRFEVESQPVRGARFIATVPLKC